MNIRTLTFAAISAVLLTGGSAFAGEATPDYPQAFHSSLTREQVRAEALEARRLGAIANGDATIVISPAIAERIRMAGLNAAMMTAAAR
jgi:hypothetical protein